MKFDTPAGENPIDRLQVVSHSTDRIDGPLKTTGRARYAYEHQNAAPNPAYGYVIGASIAKGRIIAMDLQAAGQAPGGLTIVTAETAGKLDKGPRNAAPLLGGPEIAHYHQAVALVVAETFEMARAAAMLVRIQYEETPGAFDLSVARATAGKPTRGIPDTSVGNFDAAFAAAPVQLDQHYTTPDHSHSMMEPHATTASWNGDELTVWSSSQMVNWGASDLALTLGIPREKIRLFSPFVGGGFGSKLFLRTDAVLAALGARAAQRPVKVALTRPLIPNNTTHRAATIQRIRIGATPDGKITAIGHESWSGNLPGGRTEDAVDQTRLLYAGANRMTATRLASLDLPEGNAMRAPGEASGLMALEIAMDEMAEKLDLDPVEFRIINDTQVDPEHPDRHYSLRNLVQCLRTGAGHFGWDRRERKPGQRRDREWLVGMGVAAGFRNNLLVNSAARVRLNAQGIVTVETDMTDIGTGSYTIIAQTAAEMMGVPLHKVVVKLGDSSFPVSSGSGGQFGANGSTSGVYAACMKLRDAVAQKVGFNSADTVFANSCIRSGNKIVSLADACQTAELVAEDRIEFEDLAKKYQQSTFAGQFVEVGVHAATGEIRVRRMLSVCASGRILNPKTARSQVIGAMTMGVGAALMEALAVDKQRGFFVNHDLAGYEVPVHADIPHQDVIFLEEPDPISSPMKSKGIGELGLCGVAAAVANAVYNATGVRVRDYPITLDKLIDHLPDVA